MIIANESYRRNKLGEISKRQVVTIQCDRCRTQWDSLYEHRKRKKYAEDLCVNCRAKERGKHLTTTNEPVYIICSYCGKEFLRHVGQVKTINYCSRDCQSKHTLWRYAHLEKSFSDHPNELAYLCGLILGDGHLKSSQKYTTKICIAFDVKYPELIQLASEMLSSLEIHFSIEPQTHASCQMINFSLPNDLLKKYNMLWSGNKYDAQPKPISSVINNIDFAAGYSILMDIGIKIRV